MENVVQRFAIQVDQIDGFEFRVRFDKAAYSELRMDEPPPLGRDTAPNPVRILAAAIGNCLAASLVFCAKKHGTMLSGVRADVSVQIVRNAERRLRVGQIDVELNAPGLDPNVLAACVPSFEEFCTVTQSVRDGINVNVRVQPA
jgi:uncharacterized OsmC-like protein